MIDPVALQSLLARWPEEPESASPAAARLGSALRQACDGSCGPGDLAGLIRDHLREWQETRGSLGLPAPVRVPAKPPWPTRAEWAKSGVVAVPGRREGELELAEVDPWQPAWLPFAEPVDSFPARRENRWPRQAVAADPIWREGTSYSTYRSFEQREAVRVLVTAPVDATVLVVLTTGSGKSLVGLLHALTAGRGSVTVVVVPTTSLAIDQEGQLRRVLRRRGLDDADARFAWHTGLDGAARGQMLAAVRDGRQRAVFTSPEALFGALGDTLLDAARAGRLGQFVVDEAHMVSTWGTDFRPDFQALAGYRRQLRTAAFENDHRFRTVLMSATVTATDVVTLSSLFADDGARVVVAGAPSLRPEIAYLAAQAPDPDIRLERVCEAVLHLPRPVFVYTTTKPDVAELADALRCQGIKRLVTVTGASTDGERRDAVDSLRGADGMPPAADIAVGTSAFGLGIDVPDVRAVIHACLPETIDRYYQEVGRAGRDGRAALGLLVWTASDEIVATRISTKRVIGVPLARQRWNAMRRAGQLIDRTTWVPLSALRIGLHEENDGNEDWNARTLASMSRAGFVELVGSRREAGTTRIGVRIRRADLGVVATWSAFEDMRTTVREQSRRSLNSLVALARDGRVCERLLPIYTVQDADRLTADLVVHDTCGGCTACAPPRPVPVAPLAVDRPPARSDDTRLHVLLTQERGVTFAVAESDTRWPRNAARLVAALAHSGVRQVVGDAASLQVGAVVRSIGELVASLGTDAPLVTELLPSPAGDEGLEVLPLVPTLLLLDPRGVRSDLCAILDALPRPLVALVSSRQNSTIREDMTLREMHPALPDIPDIIDRLRS